MRPGKRKGASIQPLQQSKADMQLNQMIASIRINGLEEHRPPSLQCLHLAHFHLCQSLLPLSQHQIQIEDRTALSALGRVRPPLHLA